MNYIDLGLPSGTLWADENIEGLYNYEDAVAKYGNTLPTMKQLKELRDECVWERVSNGFKVTGPNGNSIVLPADGYRNLGGYVQSVGSCGDYYSSTPCGEDYACSLFFDSYGSGGVYGSFRRIGKSVRLVKIK